jgi:glycosyltransferase involved in cell wall biosynthesis
MGVAMKIMIVSAMFPPVQTGTSFYTKNLAHTLHNSGNDVNVVTVSRQGGNENDLYPFKVTKLKALKIPIKGFFKHLSISSIFISNYFLIDRECKISKPDLIIVVNQYLDVIFPAIHASRKNSIPMYVSIGTQLQSSNFVRNKILQILDYLICGHIILPFSKKIICWDREIQRYVHKAYHGKFDGKTVIIPFGVNGDQSDFTSHSHSYELRGQILGVGAVIGHRNFIFNIKVFKELLAKYPHLKMKIIGHIYNKEAVQLVKELGLENNVLFTGELEHNKVLDELKVSDLHWMMLDGEYKGLGTSNLEAMQMGVPIISNIPENLFGEHSMRDMKEYINVREDRGEEAISKIIKLLESEVDRKAIGLAGREFCRQQLNWGYVGGCFNKILKSEDLSVLP